MVEIATTHTGSLLRPRRLVEAMWAKEDGAAIDDVELRIVVEESIDEVVRRQVGAGVTVVNDGEMSKPSYATYVKDRLGGFEGESVRNYHFADLVDFPGAADIVAANPGRRKRSAPACTGPITVTDPDAAVADMVALSAAAERHDASGVFSSAASPGVVSLFFGNDHYDTDEAYLFAIADAMQHEYEAIAATGATVQLDCPDLAMGRHTVYAGLDDAAFESRIRLNLRALDHAVRNIDPTQLRMHLCWGNYPGPHHHDVAIETILPAVLSARPATILFEAANPRHAHEWQVFETVELPPGKTICPGVIEPQSPWIEHPELVAERIGRYARLVGADRVMAGVDCGFSVHVGMAGVDPEVMWAKLEALAQGAALASARL